MDSASAGANSVASSPAAADARLLTLVRELISRPSVTPQDGGCMELIAARLAASGFVAERIDRNGVSNLWLRRGRARPTFVFAGHTDVVPTGPAERWSADPFAPTEREGMLYGRGAADMKTSIAAFVVAAEEYVARYPEHPGSIALLLTSDEEGPALDGTVAVVEALSARGEAIDFCLVGEPTCVERLGDTIKNGRRGSLTGRLKVRGVQGHVAYPHLALNPIHELAPALEEIVAMRWDHGNSEFQPTSLQITNIHSGTGAGNVIPDHCVVDFNLRFAPVSSPESLRSRIESILYSHELEFEIQWTVGALPFQCSPGRLMDAVSGSIREVMGFAPTPSTTGGTSDGRFIARVCQEVVEFGPQNTTSHKVDECVRIADIGALKEIYLRTVSTVLAQA